LDRANSYGLSPDDQGQEDNWGDPLVTLQELHAEQDRAAAVQGDEAAARIEEGALLIGDSYNPDGDEDLQRALDAYASKMTTHYRDADQEP
jgi:hypothetical protein